MANFLMRPTAEALPPGIREEANRTAAQKEAIARQAGYRNYAEMMAFLQAQNNARSGSVGEGAVSLNGVPTTRSQMWDTMMAWHPKNLIQRATDALSSANR